MPAISILDVSWILLAVIFFYFAILFWTYSNQPLRPFSLRERGGEGDQEAVESSPEDLPQDTLRDLEGFLATVNRTNQVRFRIGAVGFFIGGALALFSAFFLT